jgi:uncharacterized Ntn-hydrolase superfamily protein
MICFQCTDAKLYKAYVATDILSAERVLYYEAYNSSSSVTLDLTDAALDALKATSAANGDLAGLASHAATVLPKVQILQQVHCEGCRVWQVSFHPPAYDLLGLFPASTSLSVQAWALSDFMTTSLA